MEENNACQKLAGLAAQIAAPNQYLSPTDFILLLGEQSAGIRRGLPGLSDLGRGGQFRPFVGIAVSSVIFGSKLTVWLSENVRRDSARSPDGRLTLAAVDFSQKLLKGELPLASAGQWLCDNLCNPGN